MSNEIFERILGEYERVYPTQGRGVTARPDGKAALRVTAAVLAEIEASRRNA